MLPEGAWPRPEVLAQECRPASPHRRRDAGVPQSRPIFYLHIEIVRPQHLALNDTFDSASDREDPAGLPNHAITGEKMGRVVGLHNAPDKRIERLLRLCSRDGESHDHQGDSRSNPQHIPLQLCRPKSASKKALVKSSPC